MSTLPSPSSRWSVEPSQLERVTAALPKEFLRRNAALAPYTTFKIGGPADLLLEATSADVLADAVMAARAARVPCFVLGLGANVLVGDLGVRGLVVRNTASRFEFSPEGRLDVETGAVMARLIPEAVRRGWSGLEHYVGIPSTVGGAIWQNLHFLSPAPERERTMFIAEVFESAELLTQENGRMVADAAYMRFGYDDSVLHHRSDIALKATFQLARKSPDEMHRIMQENLSWRGSRHPWLEYHPSVGSIFKKIEGIGAGRLVDQCGLKGYRVGDVQISHIHANIMVNLGNATSSDVLALIRHAQRSVKERFGYDLGGISLGRSSGGTKLERKSRS